MRIGTFTLSIAMLAALVGCGEDNGDSGSSGLLDDGAGDDGGAGGAAGDGGGGALYPDADGDTILDIHEGEVDNDYDGDGKPNFEDDDSDDDDISDRLEAGDEDPLTLPVDTDGDGSADFLDLDSDDNCVLDKNERGASPAGGPADTDADSLYDFQDFDNDGDGILDVQEIGSDCVSPDTDGDGTCDYMDTDSDADGIGDKWEAGTTEWQDEPQDTDGDGTPDYLDTDSDDDGLTDRVESGVTSLTEEPRDTDGDGRYDFEDTDSDGDGLSDFDEINIHGTDPFDFDSDGDGFSDGGELAAGTDPLDDTSIIDGIYIEVPERTEQEEDFEFELRIQMGDVAFIIDTTGSMTGTANAMASEFSAIVETLANAIPDAEYGVATHDDYAYAGYGYKEDKDKPFYLRQQITDDVEEVQDSLSTEVEIHYGGDSPESSMEALYQGATGAGYDQGCDGSYDDDYDVLPFLANSDDPFGGGGGEWYDASTSGGGTIGGFGFREFALPVLVYATDNYMRDPEIGYGVPGGCPTDAGKSDVLAGVAELGGYLVGVSVSGRLPEAQMLELAEATGSFADTDDDGSADDPLVFTWSGSNAEFRETVTGAIEDLVNAITFEKVELQVEGDDWGFVTRIAPEYYADVADLGTETLEFALEFRGVVAATTEDQLFRLTLNVIGDESILLDSYDIVIVVPGTSY